MSQQSFAPPTNTPRKQGANRSVADSKVTLLAQEIRELVQQELGNTQMVTDPGPFFEKILPVSPERVQKIFDHLKTEKYYSNKTWRGLPTGSVHATESSIYKPFVDIANEINQFVARERWMSKDQIEGRWVDCNSSSPTTLEMIKSSIRPDCAFVSVKTDEKILEKWRNDEGRVTRSKKKELKGEQSDKDLKTIRWLQMLTAVEVKKDLTPQNVEEALGQLCCYAREIFRNQVDRRFVIGLTLCGNSLRAYVFDRSGVLGIKKGIDINRQPLKFVQALAAFSLLHFEDMGWDPTMTLYYKNMQASVRSFSFPWKEVKGKFAPQWIVEVNGTPYVTLMALSTMDAQVMSGRATLVWEVCELSKFKTKNSEGAEIFVLKQSWQRISGEAGQHPELEVTPLENFCYETAGIVEGRLKEGVYVHDRSNNIVSTSCSIRKNLAVTGEPIRGSAEIKAESTGQASKSRPLTDTNSGFGTASSGMTESERKRTEWLSEKDRAFVDRRLTRILMRRRGYKLMRFASLREFLLALSNGIKLHEICYKAGILHRDISPNNIIICHWSQQMGEEVGDLIDFDHAKITKKWALWREIQRLKEPKDLDKRARGIQSYLRSLNTPLSLATVKSCLRIMSYIETPSYMAAMFSRFPSRYPENNDREMELEDLGLEEPVSPRPHFKADVGLGQLTGTPAYMSHEILAGRRVVHNAIHDMESFFWILVEYAMIYQGPGGFETEVKSDPELQKLLYAYFDSGSSVRKADLFPPTIYEDAEDQLENDLVSKIQDYFKPVENLVKEWWKILFTAFHYKAFELANIHRYMHSILMDTVQEIERMDLPEHPYTVKERNRRERLDEAIRRAFEDQRMVTEEDMEDGDALENNMALLDIGDEEEDVFGGH